MSANIVKTNSYAVSAPPLGFSSAARNRRGKESLLHPQQPPLVRSFPRSSVGMQPWALQRPHCAKGRISELAWRRSHPLSPCGRGILFFACPKKRNKRKGSPAAETTPFAKVQNRRGNNSLRSNSLPLHPVPRLAARLSANGPHRARIPLNETSRNPTGRPSVAAGSG